MFSLLYNSIRIALNYEEATIYNFKPARKDSLRYCVTSAEDIITLVRNYKLQYGLRYSPLILIYATIQASRSVRRFGIPEEYNYLVSSLVECSETWSIASQVQSSSPTERPG
jgi:chloramphenicol O-acetyltransferase